MCVHPIVIATCWFFFQGRPGHRDLHSFPTRRSSDLFDGSMSFIQWPRFSCHKLSSTSARANGPNDVTSRLKRTDRKSTRLNSSHVEISYAVFCLKKKKPKSNSGHALERASAAGPSPP